MYPNLYYLVQDLFGIKVNALKLINSFGFFVALAFIASGYVLYKELKRKEKLGEFIPLEESYLVGAPATKAELISGFGFGFLFGLKIVGAFVIEGALNNTQAFILSFQGSYVAGFIVGAVMLYLKWKEKDKVKLPTPEIKKYMVWPHDRVGDIVLQAALWGFIGAKIFHNLENLDDFTKDPIGSLISFSGLTFYGGLIIATFAIIFYIRRFKIRVIHFADAMAPTMLFAYAAGRIGCHVSGDGDWGMVNVNPKPFTWLPDWMWAYKYPHNVINEGVAMPNCVNEVGSYCHQLASPVYPTTFYEVVITFVLFIIIWMVRKKITQPGIMAGIYLIFAGGERFFIEKIRVNNRIQSLPFHPTQAELISLFLILIGIVFLVMSKKWFPKQTTQLN
jgi:phosphatidylglycerol:prolipoprotein diacylglycerol transferase